MKSNGIDLLFLIGPRLPLPAIGLAEHLESAEVLNSDSGRSGFQVVLRATRTGLRGKLDYNILKDPRIRPFNRMILVVSFGGVPSVVLDGIITHQQLTPGHESGDYITLTGEDISTTMDMTERIAEHPGQADAVIVTKILAAYAQYGLVPKIRPPPVAEVPLPTERIPVQHGTDLEYVSELASRHGFVFYVAPGPLPGVNTAYWGPPVRLGVPQPALTANVGEHSNVESITFSHDALAPVRFAGRVQDRMTNVTMPLLTLMARRSPLSREPTMAVSGLNVRTSLPYGIDGLPYTAALARLQGLTDSSVDNVLTAHGVLDSVRYGRLLKARGIVGVRGAGDSYDGMYYVKSVRHTFRKGSYKQNFTLTRDGVGSLSPMMVP